MFQLNEKVRLTASLVFDTAWRVGSGKEGETMSDLGVMLTTAGEPILPGSSLKGKLRSTCETLSHALGLNACMLNHKASGVKCTSDVDYYRKVRDDYQKALKKGLKNRCQWIDKHTCDVCKLFGSPVKAGRLWVSDGMLKDWASVVQVRDGVVIDRDSRTAVDGLKYDYEVVPPSSLFELCIDLENPTDADIALLGAALFEWCAGSSLGGFTSRGLGRFHLEEIKVFGVDLNDPDQQLKFLTKTDFAERFSNLGNWESYFSDRIKQQLQSAANNQQSPNPAGETEED
ncbi:MAG: CRISPR-associated RAMP protein Csx7 [Candidatus Poribacteria bacterium]|nr:CRISPR-associated RAMP protein Csx7 [Candidatus Poribacteria bacterium]